MRFKSRFCLFALCALAMVLSFMAVGCSDSDRAGGKEQIKTKTFTYVYTKSLTKGVPSTAEHVYAAAYDSANKEVSAVLADNDAWKNYDDTKKTYSVVTVVDEKTDHMLYTFTSKDASGKEVEIATLPVYNVTNIQDGGTCSAGDATVEYSCKYYGSDGKELTADKVIVGDQFSVRVFATDSTAKKEVEVTDVSLTYAPLASLEKGTDGKYTAKEEGPVKFSAEIDEVMYKEIGTITVVKKEVPGEPALYVCPQDWTVNSSGKLFDDKGVEITDASSIPTSVVGGVNIGDSYTFVVVHKNAEGVYKNVSNDATLIIDNVALVDVAGMKITAKGVGDIVVTAKYDTFTTTTNNLNCNLSYEENVYLCPAGYTVAEDGTLNDENGQLVADPDKIPEGISGVYYADALASESTYTFVVVYRSADGKYTDCSGAEPVLSVNPTGGITFSDCVMSIGTTDKVAAEEHEVSAKIGEDEAANTLKFTPDKYEYSSYLCPEGYRVDKGKLIDENLSVVEVENIPKNLELTLGIESTLFVAVYGRDGVLVNGTDKFGVTSSAPEYVTASPENTTVNPVTVTPTEECSVLTACSQNVETEAKNSIKATVKAQVIKTYICPNGYTVKDDKLYKSDGETEVTEPGDIEDEVVAKTSGLSASYEFVLVTYNESLDTWSTATLEEGQGLVLVYSENTHFVEGKLSYDKFNTTYKYLCYMGINDGTGYKALSENEIYLTVEQE